jgi:HEAT repeat protein
VVDWSDTLEEAFASGNEDRLINALKINHDSEEVPSLVKILRNTRSPRVRNAAAIALADMHPPNAAKILIEVIAKPETKNSRGTLLYALEEVRGKAPLNLLVSILLSDPYEARQEALRFITSGNIRTPTRRELSESLSQLKESSPIDDEQIHSVREAMSALRKLWSDEASTLHGRYREKKVRFPVGAFSFSTGLSHHDGSKPTVRKKSRKSTLSKRRRRR